MASDWLGAQWLYSRLMNTLIQNARLLLWRREKGLSPASYCPDLKTAAFGMTVMGHGRVCPQSNEVFIPPADTVEYCKPAHGVAYRTVRSRWNKKERKEKMRQRKKQRIAAQAIPLKRHTH